MNQARQRKTPTPSRLNAATRPSCNFTLFYIDDSGSEAAGCTTFSWIEISPATWTDAADRWNNYRTALYERYGIPTADRLHATDLATGRGYRTRGTAGKIRRPRTTDPAPRHRDDRIPAGSRRRQRLPQDDGSWPRLRARQAGPLSASPGRARYPATRHRHLRQRDHGRRRQ